MPLEIGVETLTVVGYKGTEIVACEQTGIAAFVPGPLTFSSKGMLTFNPMPPLLVGRLCLKHKH